MFFFAHVFCGALIGLGFWHLTHDRRALPLCILGAILCDLLDKSLALTIPEIFGSGRTLGHSLLCFTLIVAAGILVWHYRRTLLGIAFACVVFSHQILDMMWTLPATWYYPLMGPFPVSVILDYVGHYFWLEISTPSEWVFGYAACIIMGAWYVSRPEHRVTFLAGGRKTAVRFIAAILLGIMGVYLLVYGLAGIPLAFFAPTYNPATNVMAGLIALCGTLVLLKLPQRLPGI